MMAAFGQLDVRDVAPLVTAPPWRYEIDAVRSVVRLRESYGLTAGLVAQVGGSAQALPNGHTLVSFGSAGDVEEYDAAGTVVWRLTGRQMPPGL